MRNPEEGVCLSVHVHVQSTFPSAAFLEKGRERRGARP